jgi:hypothetical protein
MQARPSSTSSWSVAYPRPRTSANCARNTSGSVIVWGVCGAIPARARSAAASSGGECRQQRLAQPRAVQMPPTAQEGGRADRVAAFFLEQVDDRRIQVGRRRPRCCSGRSGRSGGQSRPRSASPAGGRSCWDSGQRRSPGRGHCVRQDAGRDLAAGRAPVRRWRGMPSAGLRGARRVAWDGSIWNSVPDCRRFAPACQVHPGADKGRRTAGSPKIT